MKNIALPPDIKMEWHSQLDSTNLCLLQREAQEGLLVVADEQVAGRGRLGRTWQSLSGMNLYFSFALRPSQSARMWGTLPLTVGVGVAEALISMGFSPGLKWPNDVFLDRKKVGGILLEAKDALVVAGVGLNVNQQKFPGLSEATSLSLAAGKPLNRQQVLETTVNCVWSWYCRWRVDGPREMLQQWRKYDVLLGREVTVDIQGRVVSGMAVDIAPDGCLKLGDASGQEILVSSGDATLKPFVRA